MSKKTKAHVDKYAVIRFDSKRSRLPYVLCEIWVTFSKRGNQTAEVERPIGFFSSESLAVVGALAMPNLRGLGRISGE